MIINRTNMETLFTGFNAAFLNGIAAQEARSHWMQVAMETSSMTASEVYPWLGKMPSMKEWVGERVVENLSQYSFEIRNKDYEDTVSVDRNSIEDDSYGVYTPLFQRLGAAVAAHPDEMVWPLLKKGHATACYDGQNFFDTDHPVVNGGRQQGLGSDDIATNRYGSDAPTWYLMDLMSIMKPVVFQRRKRADNIVRLDRDQDPNVFMRREFIYGVDCRDNVGFGLWQTAAASSETLNESNFTKAYQNMESMKGDHGRPLGLKPTHLVVPPSMRSAATKLMQNELGTAGETNTVKGWAEVLVTPWLA